MPPRRKRAAASVRARPAKRTKPRMRARTQTPLPSPTPEPVQILYEVVDGIPVSQTPPDYSQLKSPLSIVETGALLHTLHRSRNIWLAGDMFHKYWTRPPRGRKLGAGEVNAREKMTKLCECSLEIGPHVFEVKLFMVKDDLVMEETIETVLEDTQSLETTMAPSGIENTSGRLVSNETIPLKTESAISTSTGSSVDSLITEPTLSESSPTKLPDEKPQITECLVSKNEIIEPTKIENIDASTMKPLTINTKNSITEPDSNFHLRTISESPPQISQADGPSRMNKWTSDFKNIKNGLDKTGNIHTESSGPTASETNSVSVSNVNEESKSTQSSESELLGLVQPESSLTSDSPTDIVSKNDKPVIISQNLQTVANLPETPSDKNEITSKLPTSPKRLLTLDDAKKDPAKLPANSQTTKPLISTTPDVSIPASAEIPLSSKTMIPPAPTSISTLPQQSNRDALHSPENQAMIAKLHEMAGNTPSLLELMKIVASGNAPPDQIARFQTYIAQARAENAAVYRQQQLQSQQPPQNIQQQSQHFFEQRSISNTTYYQQQQQPMVALSPSMTNNYPGQHLHYQQQYNQQNHGPLSSGYIMGQPPMMSQGYKAPKFKAPRAPKPKRVKAPKLPKPPKAPKAPKAPKTTKVLKSSTVVFEFKENPINRYLVPKDAIVEVIKPTGEVLISLLSLHSDVPELEAEIEYKKKETNYKELLAEQLKRRREKERKSKIKSKNNETKETKVEEMARDDDKKITNNEGMRIPEIDEKTVEKEIYKEITENGSFKPEEIIQGVEGGGDNKIKEGKQKTQIAGFEIIKTVSETENSDEKNSTPTTSVITKLPTATSPPTIEHIGQSDGSGAENSLGKIEIFGASHVSNQDSVDKSLPPKFHAESDPVNYSKKIGVGIETRDVPTSTIEKTYEANPKASLRVNPKTDSEIYSGDNIESGIETDKISEVPLTQSETIEISPEVEVPKLPSLKLTDEQLREKYEGIKFSPVTITFRGVPTKLIPIVACTVNDQVSVYQKMEAIIKYGVRTKKNYAWLQVEATDQELVEQLKQPAKPPSNMYVPARIRVYKKRPSSGAVSSSGVNPNCASSPVPEQVWQGEEPVSKKVRHNLMVADLPISHK